jgi:hypothetical protein
LHVLFAHELLQATDSSPAGVALRREGKDLSSRLFKVKYELAPFDMEEYKTTSLKVRAHMTLLKFAREELADASQSCFLASLAQLAAAAADGSLSRHMTP